MKKGLFVSLITMVLTIGMAMSTLAGAIGTVFGDVNIRQYPDANSALITTLHYGDTVEAQYTDYGPGSDGIIHEWTNIGYGWIRSDLAYWESSYQPSWNTNPPASPEPAPFIPSATTETTGNPWGGSVVGPGTVVTSAVNVRAESTHNSALLGTLYPGTTVKVLGEGSGLGSDGVNHKWVYVSSSAGITGWVRSDLLDWNLSEGQSVADANNYQLVYPTNLSERNAIVIPKGTYVFNNDEVNMRSEPNANSLLVITVGRHVHNELYATILQVEDSTPYFGLGSDGQIHQWTYVRFLHDGPIEYGYVRTDLIYFDANSYNHLTGENGINYYYTGTLGNTGNMSDFKNEDYNYYINSFETALEASGFYEYIAKIFNTGNEGLALKSEPDINSYRYEYIPDGTEIIIDSIFGEWGHTFHNGNYGWVYLPYTMKFDNPWEKTEDYGEVSTDDSVNKDDLMAQVREYFERDNAAQRHGGCYSLNVEDASYSVCGLPASFRINDCASIEDVVNMILKYTNYNNATFEEMMDIFSERCWVEEGVVYIKSLFADYNGWFIGKEEIESSDDSTVTVIAAREEGGDACVYRVIFSRHDGYLREESSQFLYVNNDLYY